jgi:hypothetical protein
MYALVLAMMAGAATAGIGLIVVSAARAIAGRRFERELRRAYFDEIGESPGTPSTVRRAT